ncbi:protein NO VEIN domain-containing protein [Aliiroseovarius sp. S253]|uniref:protein NO VEIN domain-containing protein n=1 Tax=Aliiroseovarius sp. S253 TaxID=3415133 RepID=UPI003C7B8E1C
MYALNNLRPGDVLTGINPKAPVHVVAVSWIGKQAVNLVYRDESGVVSETTLFPDDEARLGVVSAGRPWALDGDGSLLRLLTEANRIKLAYHFDPFLAMHTSLVEPLPHQISAVYGEMLPRQPLRFLLADDPGAGKTIMSGLLIKELIARSDLDRCLVVAPGSLVEQWQDELGEKFHLEFDILSRDMIETSRSGNPFNDRKRLIARLDVLARNEDLQDKLRKAEEWDLIICDEAHRMSATFFGGDVKYTKRYQLGQLLGTICRHFLLMSATPHNGKEEDFQLFMALLDGDRFEGRFRDGVHFADTTDMMRRLTKEELLKFDGRPLFPERRAYTVKYELSDLEASLYAAVSDYVRNEMNRVMRFAEGDGKKRNNVGFALQILQRRLASSPAAIFQSLKRRRERLEAELGEAKIQRSGTRARWKVEIASEEVLRNIDEFSYDEVEDIEDELTSSTTSAESIEQLEIEVETLKGLEQKALQVLSSGRDTKWSQLNKILDDNLMSDDEGNRRKLIIFTEPKDTLFYLQEKVRSRIGKPEAVEVIHGGVTREERRKITERFMQDKDLLVLIANDAAGEGVNLQRGHLMVNYDLPWNPNKIEQRFGRIHRIGQTEVCHLWNLVAADTREGEVYARLLDKLEAAREALGGRVYDVLGELFEGTALRDLLFEAIQYGERPDVKAQLFQKVDGAVDQGHLLDLLKRRALTNETMPAAQVEEIRKEIERAEAQRLQPHHIQSFFVEGFRRLGGKLTEREVGRFELHHVPVVLRERDRQIGLGAPLQKKYERVCFEKSKINQQPVAEFVCPGHPLLESLISILREKYGHVLKQGSIFIDDTDEGDVPSAIFLLDHAVKDASFTADGVPHVVSEKLQFVSVDQEGTTESAGIAPHLNFRPATDEEVAIAEGAGAIDWFKRGIETQVIEYATLELAQKHLSEVRERKIPEIEKVEREVRTRLRKEINFWDNRAAELREDERAGKKTRLNWRNAERRAEELADRLKRRLEALESEKFLSSVPPNIRGGMLVLPKGLIAANQQGSSFGATGGFSEDPVARREIELKAMEAVTAAEKALGNEPKDVSAQKVGYDIESFDPTTGHFRFIEVKGRIDSADTVMLTRQEIITSLHEPDKYILAIVKITEGYAQEPRYVRGALQEHEPSFDTTAIQFKLKGLLERSEVPN